MVSGVSDPKRLENENEGPKLSEIGLLHSSGWMHSFIEDPTRFHGDTAHMGKFGPPVLTHQEIEEIALYLSNLQGAPSSHLKVDIHDTFPEPGEPVKKGRPSP